MQKQTNYSKNELTEIRSAISGSLTPGDVAFLKGKFKDPPPQHMIPLIKLAISNTDLYDKVCKDERTKDYSLLGFFPETFNLVYGSETSPKVSFSGGTRGWVAIIDHPDKKIVIKPFQSSGEDEIAKIASDLGAGPRQLETLPGFLTEVFVDGKLFTQLGNDKTTPESMAGMGRRTGEILFSLHSKDIYYNDTILGDDMGKSHIIVPEKSPLILFDYGASINLSQHPKLSDEDVFNFVRTLPGINSMIYSASQEEISALISEYRIKVQGYSKKEISSRDIWFVKEGLFFASMRLNMPQSAFDAFSAGFRETYR